MIFNIAILTAVVSAIIFSLLTKKSESTINAFGLFLVLNAIFEVSFYITSTLSSNLYLVPIYDVAEFVLLSTFFICLHNKSKLWYVSVGLGVILIIINALLVQTSEQSNSYSSVFNYFIFISLSIVSLFKLMSMGFSKNIDEVVKYFLFGLILNFSGSFVLYLFANIISDFSIETQKNLWYISVTLNIIAQILYSVGLVKYHILSRNR